MDMINSYGLDMIEDGPHDLLEPPSPAYSNVTVRRAFIVWLYTGQKNKFKHVCNYYHYLEALEEKLPADKRAVSRHHELDLFTNPPPMSPYLRANFPNLYSDTPIDPYYVQKLEAIKNEKFIFKLEGFNELRQKGVASSEILEASHIIRKYCKAQLLTLRKFLHEFHEYANKCGLKDTVTNVTAYIKRKMVQAELETVAKVPSNFSFLNSTTDSGVGTSDDYMTFGTSTPINVPSIEENDVETNQLKLLLGVQAKSPRTKGFSTDNITNEKGYNSCTEFFKSFRSHNNLEWKSNSFSHLMTNFDDYNKVLSQERIRSKSVECMIQGKRNIVDAFVLDGNPGFSSDFTKLRKI